MHRSEPVILQSAIVTVLTAVAHWLLPDETIDPHIVNAVALILLTFVLRRSVVSPATHDRERGVSAERGRNSAMKVGLLAPLLALPLSACRPPEPPPPPPPVVVVAPEPEPEPSRTDRIRDAATDRAVDELLHREAPR